MIHSTTHHHLNQLKEVIVQLNDDEFCQPLTVLEGSSIGKHVRHILEFYLCLSNSLEDKVVNYDLRKRDLQMETSVDKCLKSIEAIAVNLGKYDSDFELTLKADHSLNDEKHEISLNSTYYRELLYNIEHVVHHLAIIRIGLQSLKPSICLGESVGVAASTIKSKRVCAQ